MMRGQEMPQALCVAMDGQGPLGQGWVPAVPLMEEWVQAPAQELCRACTRLAQALTLLQA